MYANADPGFFSKGQLCLPGGSGFFFRYTCIYYKNLILNFPWARGSGPLGIFKLFIRSAHGIYLFVCNFMLSVIVCISFGSLPHAVKKTTTTTKNPQKSVHIKMVEVNFIISST